MPSAGHHGGMPLEDVQEESLGLVTAAAREARAVFHELVLPTWGTDRHGWPRTLYGHVMGAFSLLDRFSQVAGSERRPQTPRMVDFAVRWLQYDRLLSNVAVHMWRHGLMHTGQPQRLIESRAGTTWHWLLHWGSHLPREHHMTQSSAGKGENVLNFALLYFLEDLHVGVERWLRAVNADLLEANRIVARHAELAAFEVALQRDRQ